MFTLYHYHLCPSSRFIRLLLDEYNIEYITQLENYWKPQEDFLLLNPAGHLPVLIDSYNFPIVGFNACVEYIKDLDLKPNIFCDNYRKKAEIYRLYHWFDTLFKKEVLDDLALLTGATIINEDLGDDMDLIQVEHLGNCLKSVTTHEETILQFGESSQEVLDIIDEIKNELSKDNPPHKVIKLEKRLAMLAAKIAIVKVGANSDIELKEKTDRVEDAICATKAAIKEGIVPGGGIALLNAAKSIVPKSDGEKLLLEAIKAPFKTILENAGITDVELPKAKGRGLNVVTGKMVNMINSGIIDPLLVTKSALQNAASVATTILSTDCVINNLRIDESDR